MTNLDKGFQARWVDDENTTDSGVDTSDTPEQEGDENAHRDAGRVGSETPERR